MFDDGRSDKVFCSRACRNKDQYRRDREAGKVSSQNKSRRNKRSSLLDTLGGGLICSRCGFKASRNCQIDIDHIDGNHANNDPSNLQLLCANCHRLKSYIERLAKHNHDDDEVELALIWCLKH
jgi:5-methylcytosine-specific restriction endonuclease McrA